MEAFSEESINRYTDQVEEFNRVLAGVSEEEGEEATGSEES